MIAFLLVILPFVFSYLLGHLLLALLFRNDRKLDSLTHFFLAGGLGLGMSSIISFYSFLITDLFNKIFVLSVHALLLFSFCCILLLQKKKPSSLLNKGAPESKIKSLLFFVFLSVLFIPVWIQSKFYPMGGWDAWSVWNFKAKFLFLSMGEWKNLFDVRLWRTSPHYPLLLPLINIWGWTFAKSPSSFVPQLTSVVFTFLVAGLLFSTLKSFTKNAFSLFAPLLLITLPFYNTLATSQYCDIVLSYYCLASVYCLIMTIHLNKSSYAFLAGVFTGMLAFTKPEGLIASLLLLAIGLTQFLLFERKKIQLKTKRAPLLFLSLGALLAFLPSIFFKSFCSPGNQTFINGFMSESNPVSLYRLKMIFAFLLLELKSGKWNGIWILLVLGLVLSKGRCFSKTTSLIPFFAFTYVTVVLFYYFLNTYFLIDWWLSVTLSRILFSLLPILLFWMFASLWKGDKKIRKNG